MAAGILWMKNMSAGNYIGAKEKTSNDHGGASRIKPPKQLINCFASAGQYEVDQISEESPMSLVPETISDCPVNDRVLKFG